MKEFLKNIISNSDKRKDLKKQIEELEKEIETQDTQYIYLQTKYNAKRKQCELLIEENTKLEKANTRHLKTLKERRLRIKELENEITKA